MLHRNVIILILFLALFGGGILSLGVPSYFSFSLEILVVLFFILSLFARSGKGLMVPHLWYIFLSFIFVTFLSIFVNDYPATRSIFSLRLIFRFYFFYLAIIMMMPDDQLIKKINLFIVILLVLQFPIVAIKFAYFGISEKTAGAYAIHDGSIATTLPISFIFYLAAFYFLKQPRVSLILIGLGYIVLSVVGAKRAVFFLYPFQFMAIYYYIYVKGTGAHIANKIMTLMVVIPFVVVLSGTILYFNKSLSPDDSVGGAINPSYALEYAKKYNVGVDGYGNTYGRISTTLRVIEILTDSGIGQIFFGIGPGATLPSPFDSKKSRQLFENQYDEFKIGYGFTTMNRIGLEYGLAGVIIFSVMLVSLTHMCLRVYRKETEPYWRAFAAGSVWFSFSMTFFAFAYHWTTFFGDTMPVLYFYAMAIVYTRYHHLQISGETSLTPHAAESSLT